MKYSPRLSVADLLFSAMLGALVITIYRRLFKRPASTVVSPPPRIQPVNNPPEPCSPYQRRLPPLV
ncbi:MAG: hypothetical protein WCS94_25635 [Verrucomicrobiota bacterium]